MCCARTFEVAREAGIFCVLDAASFHYRYQDRALGAERLGADTWAGRNLRRRKERELELADLICCASPLAADSYQDAGVPSGRITYNPPGCDVARFAPPAQDDRSGPAKFVFVGRPVYHKGFDLLLDAFDRLNADYPGAQLHLAGDLAAPGTLPSGSHVMAHGKLGHDDLSRLLAGMDCLVLPSRLDSFGMVLVEALAAGVPVIASDQAGAAAIIEEGVTGWVVSSGDAVQLLDRMRGCCENVGGVRLMRGACIRSANQYDWSGYAMRARAMLAPFMNPAPRSELRLTDTE
jgi:glycosyltransferase involved in cell wall biosynthesis